MKKILLTLSILFVIIITYYIALFQFPKLFFPLEHRQRNLTFYYQKEFESDTSCFINSKKRLLETQTAIHESLKTSSFYDSATFRGNIFLTYNPFLSDSYALFQKHYHAFCLWKIDGRVIVEKYDVYSRGFDDTPILLTHELTHKLEVDILGKEQYSLTPKWLIEGYAEYISHKGRADLLFESNIETDYNRYKSVVAYLLKVKKMSEKDLFNNPPNYDLILSELKKWRTKQKQNNL